MGLPLDRFCNAIYAWCMKRIHSEEDLAKFDYMLTNPPPQARMSEIVVEAEAESFNAFAGAFGVKTPDAR